MSVPEDSAINTSMENCEKIANSICSLSMNESEGPSVYYSMNGTQDFSSDLENSVDAEDDIVSLEIPELSLNTSPPSSGHPLNVCEVFIQKQKTLMSSTPNREVPMPVTEEKKQEGVLPEPEHDGDLEKIEEDEESTMKSDNSLLEIVEKSEKFVQIVKEKVETVVEVKTELPKEEAVIDPASGSLEAKFKGGEDLLKIVIEEEPEVTQEEKGEDLNQEVMDKASGSSMKKENDNLPEIVVTEEVKEDIPDKHGKEKDSENKENIAGKMRRRSKIAVPENPPNRVKSSGKQSLIRRSILKTEVKSPAKAMKAADPMPPPIAKKRSSLLPPNFVVANKRQTLGPSKPLKRTSMLPAPAAVKPEAPAPVLKSRRTIAPAAGFPRVSPKKPLTTKVPPEIQRRSVFLNPNDIGSALAKGFECKVCKKKFRTAMILETHAKTHKSAGKSGFVCKYCERRFEIKHGLENHIQNYCTKIPVGEKRRLLAEEAKLAALTPRSKRLAATSRGSSILDEVSSAGSSSSDFMASLKLSPRSKGDSKGMGSSVFQGIAATPNKMIRCYKCRKECKDVLEFSIHISQEHADDN